MQDLSLSLSGLFDFYNGRLAVDLARHEEMVKTLDAKIDQILQTLIPGIQVDLARLDVRAGTWGAVAGILGGLVPILAAVALKVFSAH